MKIQELFESSLSRLWKHATQHDSGTISAFRSKEDCGDGADIKLALNKKRNAELKSTLLGLGYGVTKISGVYIENYGSKNAIEVREDSFIVVDLKDTGKLKRDLAKLGEKYEQDSITYSKPSGEYYLIGTNKCPNGYPGYKKELKLGKPFFGKGGEFHSKVNGRPFVFEHAIEKFDIITNYFPTEIRSMKAIAEQFLNE